MIDTRNYVASDTLKDGTTVTVRAIRAGDREALLAAFAALDRESIYTRFFTHKKELTDTELRHLTEPDSDHVVALVVANTEPRCERARRLVSSANKLPICDEALTRSFLRLRPDA